MKSGICFSVDQFWLPWIPSRRCGCQNENMKKKELEQCTEKHSELEPNLFSDSVIYLYFNDVP